jgi:hypothetical protein
MSGFSGGKLNHITKVIKKANQVKCKVATDLLEKSNRFNFEEFMAFIQTDEKHGNPNSYIVAAR